MPHNPTPPPRRDAEGTRKRLIEAVGAILAHKGFTALGVNAVAREAGVDKVLIYRYFGGLPALIRAFGQDGDFWPSEEELIGGDAVLFSNLPQDRKLSLLAGNFIRALRKRPLTQEILAWEMVEQSELTEELEAIRETGILNILERYFSAPGDTVDVGALTALIGAAVSYLVVRSRNVRMYSGVDLRDEAGWHRLEQAIDCIIQGLMHL